jgi:hypothetical protein
MGNTNPLMLNSLNAARGAHMGGAHAHHGVGMVMPSNVKNASAAAAGQQHNMYAKRGMQFPMNTQTSLALQHQHLQQQQLQHHASLKRPAGFPPNQQQQQYVPRPAPAPDMHSKSVLNAQAAPHARAKHGMIPNAPRATATIQSHVDHLISKGIVKTHDKRLPVPNESGKFSLGNNPALTNGLQPNTKSRMTVPLKLKKSSYTMLVDSPVNGSTVLIDDMPAQAQAPVEHTKKRIRVSDTASIHMREKVFSRRKDLLAKASGVTWDEVCKVSKFPRREEDIDRLVLILLCRHIFIHRFTLCIELTYCKLYLLLYIYI